MEYLYHIDQDHDPYAAGPSRPRLSPTPPPSAHRKRRPSEDDDVTYLPAHLRGGGRPRNRPKRSGEPSTQARRPVEGRKRLTRAQARRDSTSSRIATDLETIASEDAAVKREVARLNLGLRDVQGDGNCLFRALADQLWGVQKRHVEVRKLVCDYLETHKESMEAFVWPFLKDGESYEDYVGRMRQSKQFGSHIEIQAAARVFKRNIRVVMSTTSFTIPWQTERSTAPTPAPEDDSEPPDLPRRRTRSSTTSLLSTPAAPPPSSPSYATALADYIPSIRPGRSMLWLALFSQAEHFQSVRRKGDGDSGAAEVEDKLAIPHEKDTSEAARRERGEKVDGRLASAKVTEVLASLPQGHGVSVETAEGVLARTKGDLGEAVEILLEDLDLDGNDSSLDTHTGLAPEDGGEAIDSQASSSSQASPFASEDTEESDTSATSKITTPSSIGQEDMVADLKGLEMKTSHSLPTERAGRGTRRTRMVAAQ